MDWQEIQRRLLECLYRELRGNWGRIGEIEERLGISEGYLAKLCQGRNEIKLGLFLKTIDALGLDQQAFLSRALELQPAPEDYLRLLVDADDQDHAFTRMARATADLETAEQPLPAHPSATANAANVADVAACPHSEQLRRLRGSYKYRTYAFARTYLEHLDSLRYDHAEEAARLATQVAVRLIPALPGPRDERLALQCLALGIFGSARRLKGKFSVASRAFQLALRVSRRAELREGTANLLIRASYLLKDFGHFNRALELLNEALVIFVDIDCRDGMGRTSVNRGMMLCYQGDYDSAVVVLNGALGHLDGNVTVLPRSHFAAHQYLAYAFEQLGDLDAADRQLEAATDVSGLTEGFYWGKLKWLQGTLAFKRAEYARSEDLLRMACRTLAHQENPAQEALVSVDLVEALLAQGRTAEAGRLATNMTRLLSCFQNNRLAETAILQLHRAGFEGNLTPKLLMEVRRKLDEGRTGRAPFQS